MDSKDTKYEGDGVYKGRGGRGGRGGGAVYLVVDEQKSLFVTGVLRSHDLEWRHVARDLRCNATGAGSECNASPVPVPTSLLACAIHAAASENGQSPEAKY